MQNIDMQIADLVLDDEALAKAHTEIEESTAVLGDFSDKTQIYSYHIDAGVVGTRDPLQGFVDSAELLGRYIC
jgi:hypothetical protein